jgi:hypothetical protein
MRRFYSIGYVGNLDTDEGLIIFKLKKREADRISECVVVANLGVGLSWYLRLDNPSW